MIRALSTTTFLSLVLIAGGTTSVVAGGLYINEFATPSMGVAGAGAEAVADDASTNFAFHNPAGMTRLDGHQVSLGAGYMKIDTEFDPIPTHRSTAATAAIRRVGHRWSAVTSSSARATN
jgi:long-subunit fatty acid transport protein